ncbi:MAG: hypothetical protein LE180_04995 [Endomicrobium sp.]|uniref:hypothetical protein n=1 Tax=Candidatus Endomicrobiellum pyrsonymphae TaxID=1408203 RepID=UPI00358B44B7|nr:hypothetical protein [Endomicrobium sp.]
MTTSFETVNQLAEFAVRNEILTAQELAEIACDNCDKDLRNDRSFMEACKIELER